MAEESFNQLYSRYNTDNVFNRCVIVGLLDLLNNKMSYEQIWDDNVVEKVIVPFMYDFGSSDERFAQDNYTFFGTTCFNEKKIDGKFDMLPRGAIKYTGSQIDAANITNRFIKGTYLKNENGKLTSYTSFLYSIPLTFNFECEMWIDNIITAFKIEQALRETFYKNKTYYVLYRGMKVSCCVGFPEQQSIDKTVSYSFDSERQIKLTFSLAVEAYQPVFDETSKIETDKKIEHFGYDVEVLNNNTKRLQSITLNKLNLENVIYPVNTNMLIEWTSRSNVSDMCTVGISYIDENNEEHLIDIIPYNAKSYVWRIPESLSNFDQPEIVINNQDLVIENPIIKIVPNKDKFIDENSFVIVSPGLFTIDSGLVDITIDYTAKDGSVIMSNSYALNINQRKIDTENPVIINGSMLKYAKKYDYTKISVKVFYPLDNNINDKIDNLLVL